MKNASVEKILTGIPGFDLIAEGGLPKGRTTLVAGTAGSAKTIFAAQFLAEGIRSGGDRGVFVTFEESPEDIRANLVSLGWDVAEWESKGQWAFVDGSPSTEEAVFTGDYDLGALIARVESAASKVRAKRVSIDSIGSVFTRYSEHPFVIRRELLRLSAALKRLGVTVLVTSERDEEYGSVSRYGMEEFVCDNVMILRNTLVEEKRRRTIEVLKFRGARHQKGEFPFTVSRGQGIVVIPLSAIELTQGSTDVRISSGNTELDRMCGGGLFRDSIVLVSGATGCGKTLMTTEFIAGAADGERSLLLAFEESRDQLIRNARGWGIHYDKMEADGRLKIVSTYPESAGLEDHLIDIKTTIAKFKPNRIALDSLSALERVSTTKGYREFVIALTSFIKHHQMAGLFTATTPTLLGGTSVTESHISTITDSIILLRYVEMFGEMRRAITVLKMRGSTHDKQIREFSIDAKGMTIGPPFRFVTGIISGKPYHPATSEAEKLSAMFKTA